MVRLCPDVISITVNKLSRANIAKSRVKIMNERLEISAFRKRSDGSRIQGETARPAAEMEEGAAVQLRIYLPDDCIGKLVGKAGCNISAVRELTKVAFQRRISEDCEHLLESFIWISSFSIGFEVVL